MFSKRILLIKDYLDSLLITMKNLLGESYTAILLYYSNILENFFLLLRYEYASMVYNFDNRHV